MPLWRLLSCCDRFYSMEVYISSCLRASAEHLAEFYEYGKGLNLARTFQFPTWRISAPGVRSHSCRRSCAVPSLLVSLSSVPLSWTPLQLGSIARGDAVGAPK